jgi:hypothetical protein
MVAAHCSIAGICNHCAGCTLLLLSFGQEPSAVQAAHRSGKSHLLCRLHTAPGKSISCAGCTPLGAGAISCAGCTPLGSGAICCAGCTLLGARAISCAGCTPLGPRAISCAGCTLLRSRAISCAGCTLLRTRALPAVRAAHPEIQLKRINA